MKLSFLIKDCTPLWERSFDTVAEPGNDPEILSIHARVQDVRPGGLFIAIKGFKFDGHDFVDQAFEQGAAAVVVQQKMRTGHRVVEVNDSRKAMASIAANFYGNPSESMTLIGITGTNGKTTTTWILESILAAAGYNVGVIGTVNWRYNGRIFDNPVTTPESIDLQRMLKEMKDAGVTHAIMEVSSHGIDLHRVRSVAFDAAVFTNLSQDHLDYHKTMTHYFNCKKRLFTKLLPGSNKASSAVAVVNIDDEKGKELAAAVKTKCITVSVEKPGDLFCTQVEDTIQGLSATLKFSEKLCQIRSNLIGRFNLENILCAAGAAVAVNIPFLSILKGIEALKGVPGRLERICEQSGRFVFVDYAHTPDALESILATLKERAPSRLITVFGCGGDRDRAKRPMMGAIALKYSNLALATSDNPRSEDPEVIIQDILKGMDSPSRKTYGLDDIENGFDLDGYAVEPDRTRALRMAVRISKPGDTIVAAGKGHETYQVLKTGTIHFDDREVLRKAVADFNLVEVTP